MTEGMFLLMCSVMCFWACSIMRDKEKEKFSKVNESKSNLFLDNEPRE